MPSEFPFRVSYLRLLYILNVSRLGSCAGNYCVNRGGALFNDACFVFADPGVSCTDKCLMEGALCDEDALDMSHTECESVLAALGVDIASTTSEWYYNFGPADDFVRSAFWTSSIFDENTQKIVDAVPSFRTAGCIVSPTFDATDQDSFTSLPRLTGEVTYGTMDAAEAHNFIAETPTCGGASLVYRRVCACFFLTPPPTPSPTTPFPSPTSAPHLPTSPPAPPSSPRPTPFPTSLSTILPTPNPTSSSVPHQTPTPTRSHIAPGYWRTSHSSTDVRLCPVPHLCDGGIGGADDLCLGDNTGPYCLVCPSSHFASVSGVCLVCGSTSGLTASYVVGLVLAVSILLGGLVLVGPTSSQPHRTGKNDEIPCTDTVEDLNAQVQQQSAIGKLTKKLLDLDLFVKRIRRDVLGILPQRAMQQLGDLLVTIDLFTSKLVRLLPREPCPDRRTATQRTLVQVELLCPVIDQLASALSGLSGAMAGEEATAVLQIQSSLSAARALDPSSYLHYPTSNTANAVKVLLSFAQTVTVVPVVLAMRHANNIRSFLGGIDVVNFSAPKVLSSACLMRGNFYDELLFKTVGPLIMAAVIRSSQVVLRSSSIISHRIWPTLSLRCSGCLLAITYCVLMPATAAALRALPCETFDDGRTLLRADYSIDCDAAEHKKYRALGITLAIAYPIGSFGLFFGVLLKRREELYPVQIRGRPKEDDAISQEAKRAHELALQAFALLHNAYHPRAWWYEAAETCRRLLLTCMVCIGTKTSTQLWAAISFTALGLAMNVVFSPFVNVMDDCLYSIAHILTLTVLVLALLTEAGVGYEDHDKASLVGLVIIVLLTAYIVAAFVVFAMRWDNRSKDGQVDGTTRRTTALVGTARNDEKRLSCIGRMEQGDPEEEPSIPARSFKESDEPEALSLPSLDRAYNNCGGTRESTTLDINEDPGGPSSPPEDGSRSTIVWSKRIHGFSPPAKVANAQRRAKNRTKGRTLRAINARRATVRPTDAGLPDQTSSTERTS